ncbi:NIL domain-containing protein, partial [Corynebacterium casei]
LLREVNKEFGITIVVITHEMEVVRSIADKVAVMENGVVVEQGSIYEVFSNPQTSVAQSFVATSLRNTPDQVEADDLLAYDGRLFTIELAEDSGFFGAAADARNAGINISIVHGGVTTLQKHSFGKMTVRLNGSDAAIQQFYDTLNATTDIQEITR